MNAVNRQRENCNRIPGERVSAIPTDYWQKLESEHDS